MELTETNWRKISEDGYPSEEEFGMYPVCFVAIESREYKGMGSFKEIRKAELRFFGGDKTRPFWASTEKSDVAAPIENGSWHVTYWAPYIESPPDWDKE